MPDNKKDVMSFQLRAIELHERSLVKPLSPTLVINNFHFNVNVEMNMDAAQKLLLFTTKVKVYGDDQVFELGALTTACVFSLGNFEEAVKVQPDGSFLLPDGLDDVLNSVALSTTRGMMFSEFKGTLLHHALLPIIDVKSLNKQVLKK